GGNLRPFSPLKPNEISMSDNSSFTTTFTVSQPPEAVFEAINAPRNWWSGEFEGNSDKLGDEFTYRYRDLHFSKQRVTEFVPGKRVAWHVLESVLSFLEDKNEWAGTTITFDIARKGDKTELVFT